ncbi:C-X-C motif chemokine 10-like [Mixophyes fleayi]|uniref:C-X-C motif chemokine 10-like n=1 Tax=Mixophyes fleayi TaxID=3061075 RepID=UPI003F4DB6B3
MGRTLILVLCSVLLLQSCVQGMSPLGRRRCLCMGRGANSVDIKQIKKFEVFPPSAKCEKMEIIAKLKTGEEKCLNHSSKQVKSILQMAKKRNEQATTK